MPTVTTDLDGLFKRVYANDIKNLIPETARLVNAIPFSEEEKIGENYNQPVALTYEHGVTYGAPAAGAFTLRSAISMKMKNAQIDGYQIVIRSTMDYETAAKSAAGGEKSFRKGTQLQLENVMDSLTKRVELGLLYGQSGIGVGDTSANSSTTVTVVTLTTASWATGIWAGMENCEIQFFKQSDNTLVSSGTDSVFVVSNIDVENRKFTCTGSTTGITALDSALSSGDCDIYFASARTDGTTFSEMVGLNKIITNTGTLFNISAATYNLWKGNTYSAGNAALNMGKIIKGLALASGRGLKEKVTVLLNDRTWGNVASDQAAMRKFDASYSEEKAKNGFKAITFYSQNGEVELQPYNCIKEGEAYAIPFKRCKRIGAQDISFQSLGQDGKMFRELDSQAGFEFRAYTDQSIFCESPARMVKFTNIINE